MRSAVRPSQNRGAQGLGRGIDAASRQPSTIRSGSRPTMRLTPVSTVTGRSVLSRRVRQGTPSTVASSWRPPESVRQTAASDRSFTKSK